MKRSAIPLCLLIWPALLLLVSTGCRDLYETSDQAMVSNGEVNLSLAASPDNIDIHGGGQVTILAELTFTNGRPVTEAAILCTATLGTLAATSLTTDQDGIATTTLTPGEVTGWSIVVCTYKALQASVEISFYETGEEGGTQ